MAAGLHFANLIFDFDGTLVDSLPGIEASLRVALAARGRPGMALAPGALRARVGPPLPAMLAALWPELDAGEIAALVTAFRDHYVPEGCLLTEPFPGVAEMLGRFRAAGAGLFLLTNKPAAPTGAILERLGWREHFTEVCCPDDADFPFPHKPQGALDLRERHGLLPAETLLVGDALDDWRAAHAAGFAFAGAGYGYGGLGREVGHGTGLGEVVATVGAFAELAPLVLLPNPPTAHPDDYPQSLR